MVALRHEDRPHRTYRRTPLRIVRLDDGDDADVTPPLPLVRKDTLPEHTEYRDTGCGISPSCLRCPLSRCQYDEPGGTRRLVADARDREIALLRRRHRAPIMLLARTYGLSRRSIFRILAEQRCVSTDGHR